MIEDNRKCCDKRKRAKRKTAHFCFPNIAKTIVAPLWRVVSRRAEMPGARRPLIVRVNVIWVRLIFQKKILIELMMLNVRCAGKREKQRRGGTTVRFGRHRRRKLFRGTRILDGTNGVCWQQCSHGTTHPQTVEGGRNAVSTTECTSPRECPHHFTFRRSRRPCYIHPAILV